MAHEIQVKNIPSETYSFLLKAQGEMKAIKKCGQYSLSKTVVSLLENHQKLIKEIKK